MGIGERNGYSRISSGVGSVRREISLHLHFVLGVWLEPCHIEGRHLRIASVES